MKEFAPYFAMVGATVVLLGGSALAALYWAAKSGQFNNLEENSKTIFDASETPGEVTDAFPGKNSRIAR